MQRKLLKTTLFGFSKTEVCEYIARVNDEFNGKLEAVNQTHAKEKNEFLLKIAKLEEELAEYKQANSDIAQALYDAQHYAEVLKAKADKEYTDATVELCKFKDTETQKLNGYRSNIEEIKQEIAALLLEISGKLAEAENKTEGLISAYSSEEGIGV